MNIGIIGLGAQGKVLARALRQIDGTQIVGVAGGDPDAMARRAARLGVCAFASTDALLSQPDLHAVVIATPTRTHVEIAETAIRLGKHVFCETPLAHAAADAERLVELAEKHSVILHVGLLQRFDARLSAFFDVARSGGCGRIVGVRTTRLSAFEADGFGKPHHGDAFDEYLAFDIDTLLQQYGPPQHWAASAWPSAEAAMRVSATLSFETFSAQCLVDVAMPAGHPFVERIEAFGDRGHLVLDLRGDLQSLVRRDGLAAAKSLTLPANAAMAKQLSHFIARIANAAVVSRADGKSAIATLRAVQRLRELARSSA